MVSGNGLVESLLLVSEKAARIARACRQDEPLFSLLVQEKKDVEKNTRFVQDFKTLADVLVQEMIVYDLEKQFPSLKGCVYGEESNTFSNKLGESIVVQISDDESQTSELLKRVLEGNHKAADLLAHCVHSSISIDDVPAFTLPENIPDFPYNQLGIWIDPIDSTSEYIRGIKNVFEVSPSEYITIGGLNCVSVLIGVFDKNTGSPMIGIINQPFYVNSNNGWTGRCVWGLKYDFNLTSIPQSVRNNNTLIVAVSTSEEETTKNKLKEAGFSLVTPAGAGYKALLVVLGIVDAFVLTKGSTYYWDTCGCQSILKSLGGNMWNYVDAITNSKLTEVRYRPKIDSDVRRYCNKQGVIACRNEDLAKKIIEILK